MLGVIKSKILRVTCNGKFESHILIDLAKGKNISNNERFGKICCNLINQGR